MHLLDEIPHLCKKETASAGDTNTMRPPNQSRRRRAIMANGANGAAKRDSQQSTVEIWKPIPSLPEYLASSWGRIMRIPYRSEMINGGQRTYGGEPTLGVLAEGRYRINFRGQNYKVHRLICEAFAGIPSFDGAVCMHINEDATDNRPENLMWGTQKENLSEPGFRAYCRRADRGPKISSEQARKIKYGTMSAAEAARTYGISASTVSNIRGGRSWRHI